MSDEKKVEEGNENGDDNKKVVGFDEFKNKVMKGDQFYLMYYSDSHQKNRYFRAMPNVFNKDPRYVQLATIYFQIFKGKKTMTLDGITVHINDFKPHFTYKFDEAKKVDKEELDKILPIIKSGYPKIEAFSYNTVH